MVDSVPDIPSNIPIPTLTTPGFLGSPDSIEGVIASQLSLANTASGNLVAMTGTLQAPVITPQFPTVGPAPAISVPATPAYQQVVWTLPGLPAPLTASLNVSDLVTPPLAAVPPTLNLPTAPSAFALPAPSQPAVDLNFTLPTLAVSLPVAPNLLSISVAPFAGVTIPTFTEAAPSAVDLVAPTVREYQPGALYTSALLQATQASLQDRIVNQGTGLTPAVEQALWDRGREREYRAQADALLDLEKQSEQLGFMFPPGIYLDARLRIITETQANLAGHSREVMIKAAELELDNVKHALTTAEALESHLMDYTNAVEQRLFEATKYATEAYISIYNAKVQAYDVSVRAYGVKVQAYQALIQGLQLQVEVYKTEVEAERVKAEINHELVASYQIQAQVALSAIDIYKAEIAAIQAQADIQKIKVEIYGEEVRAFAAQINAYTANVEAYRAGIQGETAKQQIYNAQVEGFSALVTATVKQIEARIEAYKGQIAGKELEYDGYRAAIAGETAYVQSVIGENNVLAETFRSQVAAISTYNELLTKEWQVALEQSQRVAEIGVSAAKANAEMYVSTRSLATDAAKVSAQVNAQLGAAALNAVHWSNSISFGESVSLAASISQSHQDTNLHSNSYGTNYSYNYNHSYVETP